MFSNNKLHIKRIMNSVFSILMFVFLFLTTYVPPVPKGYGTKTIYSALGYFVISLIFLLFCSLMLIRKNKFKFRFNFIIIACLLLYQVFITLIENGNILHPSTVAYWNITLYLSLFFYGILLDEDSDEVIPSMALFLIVYTFISLLIGLYVTYVQGISFGPFKFMHNFYNKRVYGWYGNPNRLAPVLSIGIMSILYLNKKNSGRMRFFFLVIMLVFILGLILTGSRGVILSFMLSFVTTKLIYKLIKLKTNVSTRLVSTNILKALMLLIIFLFIFLLWSNDIVRNENFSITVYSIFGELKERFFRDDPYVRFRIWENALQFLNTTKWSNILFGHGYRFFEIQFGIAAHNIYVRWLIEFGVIYFVIMLALLLSLVYKLIKLMIYDFGNLSYVYIMNLLLFIIIRDFTSQGIFQVRFEGFIFIVCIFAIDLFSQDYEKRRKNEK